MDNKKAFVLCALNLQTRGHESYQLEKHGFKFKSMLGRYKGVDERSFLVIIDDKDELNRLESLLIGFNQESYLFVDESRLATLVYLKDNKKEVLGLLKEVDENEALNKENYTLDMETKLYYTI